MQLFHKPFLLCLLTLAFSLPQAQNLGVSSIRPTGLGNINDFVFADSLLGYVQGWGQLAVTYNGGTYWDYYPTPSSGVLQLTGPQDLYLLGADSVYQTSNGGQSWQALGGVGAAGLGGPCTIQFLDSLNGYVAYGRDFNEYSIFKTSDGGATWNLLPGQFSRPVMWADIMGSIDIFHFVDPDHGFAQVSDTFPFGYLVGTSNGGQTWDTIAPTKLSSFQFLNDSTGFLGLEHKTTNGGLTWDSIAYPPYYNAVGWWDETSGVVEYGCLMVPNGPDYSRIGTFHQGGDSTVVFPQSFMCTSKIQVFSKYGAYVGGVMVDVLSYIPVLLRLDNVMVVVVGEEEAIESKLQVEVFPNPSTGRFKVRSMAAHIDRIQVWDLAGKEVLQASPQEYSYQIDLTSEGTGMYFMQVECGGQMQSLKVLVR